MQHPRQFSRAFESRAVTVSAPRSVEATKSQDDQELGGAQAQCRTSKRWVWEPQQSAHRASIARRDML